MSVVHTHAAWSKVLLNRSCTQGYWVACNLDEPGVSPTIIRSLTHTILGSAQRSGQGETIPQHNRIDSPLLGGRHGKGLLAIEMEVPRGGPGRDGRCEGRSKCEVEGGAGGIGAGGGGRRTLFG